MTFLKNKYILRKEKSFLMRFYFSVLQKKVLAEIKKLPDRSRSAGCRRRHDGLVHLRRHQRYASAFQRSLKPSGNPLDNGQVEGEISLADSASFAKLDEAEKEDKKSE